MRLPGGSLTPFILDKQDATDLFGIKKISSLQSKLCEQRIKCDVVKENEKDAAEKFTASRRKTICDASLVVPRRVEHVRAFRHQVPSAFLQHPFKR